ncbi:uncharacterized protein LOC107479824 isoform X3 [Arachis duranensis]|uniref:Uncharacterized protein LOC107479824 isoform X3 n=1 Tax=Arachis duranensis TaxID=130453 RepID=A0A6P5NE03_ARADU|nr:uncharacterized protein LOC107479824 isoform X3 [Arachis duranensis]XP_025689189.1 uncharacterized protein LOC112790824 isoform X2 [Arachis hypogaea]
MDGDGKKIEMFQVGPCQDAYQFGFLIGKRFSKLIKTRLATDFILHNQLLPFANNTLQSQSLLQTLFDNNKKKFPRYWDELLGTAAGSAVPLLHILLINFRKEILAFIPKEGAKSYSADTLDDCSDVLVVGESMAIAAHNEDANVALVGHTYLIKRILPDGMFFVGYTYAGELPSCAFGFNSHGLRIRSSEISVGHCYNLIETSTRRILNVETASRKRDSIFEVGEPPFFHANMYLHLQINQVHDENSISRQKRAAALPKKTKEDFLSLLGDADDRKYPIYMTGPLLHTLCTAVFDLDEHTLSIIEGNPKKGDVSHVFSIKRCHGDHPNAI